MPDLVRQLRQALTEAFAARDMIAVSALRSALAAIGNAEAVPEQGRAAPGASGPHFAGARQGLGAGEAQRRMLCDDDVEQIVRAEIADRAGAARQYERTGHKQAAGRLRQEAQVLAAMLPSASTG